jgi:hypothetical protein
MLKPHIQLKKESSSSSIHREKTIDNLKLVPTVEYIIDEENNIARVLAETLTPITRERKFDVEVSHEEEPALINNTLYRQTTITIHLPNEEQQRVISKLDDDNQVTDRSKLEMKPEMAGLERRQPSFVYREKGIIFCSKTKKILL